MLAVVAVAWWLATAAVDRVAIDAARKHLEPMANKVVDFLEPQTPLAASAELTELCKSLAGDANHRLLVMRTEKNRVLADTGEPRLIRIADPQGVAELSAALSGREGFATRYDYPTPRRLAHLTVPIRQGGEVVGLVRASASLETADHTKASIGIGALATAVLVAVAAIAVSMLSARRVAPSIDVLRQGIGRFSDGELNYRVKLAPVEELAQLSNLLNRMAGQLLDKITGISRNVNSLGAVLSSMAEGVIAVDNERRILTLNHASSELLGLDARLAVGRNLEEAVRSTELRQFIERCLLASEPTAGDLVVQGDRRRILQARGAALRDAEGQSIGAVIVLDDVSDVRRLEHIRRDFVANVSHELKTPVASIKGFAETLLDGALDNPEDAQKFLEIIAKQADRLNAIIEDLLSLSRIEQGEESATIAFERVPIHNVLAAAVLDREMIAEERQVALALECDEKLQADINPPLLEQAVTNLIDNAIKYSEPGSQVKVVGAQANGEVTIAVSDRGCGIAAEHIPRIFERFYRVDKARSRKLGGTGLGLAIVKHIVQAHRGRVSVDSKPGQGSTFTLHLPKK
jgi:two-component system phosphate regulon sensor histidine kinase PhoR